MFPDLPLVEGLTRYTYLCTIQMSGFFFLLHSTNGNVSMLAFWKTGIQPDLWKMYLALRFAQSLEKKLHTRRPLKRRQCLLAARKFILHRFQNILVDSIFILLFPFAQSACDFHTRYRNALHKHN